MSPLAQLFNSLTPISAKSSRLLESLFTPMGLDKGDYFIAEQQIATEIGFMEEGIMRAFYRTSDGTEYNKHFFVGPCLIGGYASLITGKPNQINQEALTACNVLTAKFSDILALYKRCPDVERAARILAEQFFVQKEQREIEIVLLDADERYRIFQRDFPTLENLIPQYHIASYLGVTPTQLSRIRKKLAGR